MDITRAALERNRVTAVLLVVLILAGLQSYGGMSRSEDPGFIIRTALVMTFFPGASPERVELLVTDKLEKAIQEIPELDFVSSTSRTGVSQIYVNIKESYTEMRPIWDDLRRKIDSAVDELPDGIVGPIVNDEFGDVFGIVIGLTGDGYTNAELKDVADQVRDQLLRIADVAKVDIYGAQEERIFVEYNNARLAELGLSPSQMRTILEARNIINPGGDVAVGTQRIALEPTGNFLSVEDLRRAVIQIPGTRRLVYLEDVAHVYRGYIDPPETMMRATGLPCLGLAVSMQGGGNIITLGEDVNALLSHLETVYPLGIEFDVVAFQPTKVERKVNDFVGNLLQAISIVLLIMLITLGLRTGFVVAALIPVTMIVSFFVMSLVGVGLNQISLAALIIALGMLVDNAIVMSESIMVGMKEGKLPPQAAVGSAQELRVPLLTSSLTTAAAFLPIYLAESAVGEYVGDLFIVVTIALLSSWLLALTMTPLLCVRFLKRPGGSRKETYDSAYYRFYRSALLLGLRRPWLAVLSAIVVFVISLQGFRFIPNIFFPPNDVPTFTVELELPLGTRIERTEQAVIELESFLRKRYLLKEGEEGEGVVNWGAYVGEGGPRFYLSYAPEQASSNYGYLVINATSRKYIDRIIPELESFAETAFPDGETTIKPLLLGPAVATPVEVRISGEDLGVLFSLVDAVKAQLTDTPGAKLIHDNWGPQTPKVLIKINEARARRAGVTNQDVAVSLQALLTGFETTEFREGDKIIPVTLRSVSASRENVSNVESLNIYSQATGRNVPLKQVADAELVWEPSRILRRDRYKTVTVGCQVEDGYTPVEVVNSLEEWLGEESRSWPVGYRYEYGGDIEASVEANQSIGAKLPIGLLIIVLLLVGQFNSIRRPLIILFTIPLGLIGVVVGLLVARSYFGFMTLLGVISLMGIVINNAIVLLERIKLEREEHGLEPARAVVVAAQRRLRPIILTTMTTVGGLVPLWLGGGPMWEPMAIAIIFGLAFATMLTLGLVPVLYSLFFRVKFRDFRY